MVASELLLAQFFRTVFSSNHSELSVKTTCLRKNKILGNIPKLVNDYTLFPIFKNNLILKHFLMTAA